jgi:hypothetical protein
MRLAKFVLFRDGLLLAGQWVAEFPAAAAKFLGLAGQVAATMLTLAEEDNRRERVEEDRRHERWVAEQEGGKRK